MSSSHPIDEKTRKALQNLARHQMKRRLLADIAVDLQVCKLEGWNYKEFLIDLKSEIERILKNG